MPEICGIGYIGKTIAKHKSCKPKLKISGRRREKIQEMARERETEQSPYKYKGLDNDTVGDNTKSNPRVNTRDSGRQNL